MIEIRGHRSKEWRLCGPLKPELRKGLEVALESPDSPIVKVTFHYEDRTSTEFRKKPEDG